MAKDMTKGNPGKTLFFFAVPMVLGNLFQQLYNIIDSIIVGNYVGADALAAVGASASITFLFVAIATGLSIGSSVVISQYFGAKRYGEISDPDGAFGLFCDRTVPDAGRDFRDGRDPAVYADPAEDLFRCISLSENLFLRPCLSFPLQHADGIVQCDRGFKVPLGISGTVIRLQHRTGSVFRDKTEDGRSRSCTGH